MRRRRRDSQSTPLLRGPDDARTVPTERFPAASQETLPAPPFTRPGAQWHAEIDSYDPAAPTGAGEHHADDQVTVGPRSIAVLRSPLPAGGSPA